MSGSGAGKPSSWKRHQVAPVIITRTGSMHDPRVGTSPVVFAVAIVLTPIAIGFVCFLLTAGGAR